MFNRRCVVISANELQINEDIKVKELMVISEEGESLGLMNSSDALELAYDKGLDLVLIAPQATPPVSKIMDYGRYRFEREEKEGS